MTATFGLSYDPKDAVQGLKALESALRSAEKQGAKVPPELLKLVERAQQAAKATEDAAVDVDKLQREVDQLTKSADLAEDQLGSFAVSTQSVGSSAEKAAASVKKMDGAVGPLQRAGKAAGATREGLEKLASTASYVGDESTKSVVTGMNAVTGAMLAVTTPAGAVAATIASLVVLTREFSKELVNVADPANDIDRIALDLAKSLGFIDDAAYNLAATMRAEQKTVDAFAKGMEDASKRMSEAEAAARGLKDIVEESREAYRLKISVDGIQDVAEAERRVAETLRGVEEIRNRPISTPEEREQWIKDLERATKTADQQIRAIEQRRIALLEQERQKREQADQEAKQRQEKFDADSKQRHANRMKEIDDEAKAKRQADEEEAARKEALEEKNAGIIRERLDALRKEKDGVAAVQQQQQAGQAGAGSTNPYGEGQAPTAGQDSNPYANIGSDLPSFGFGHNFVGGGFAGELGGGGYTSFGGRGQEQQGENSLSRKDQREIIEKTIDAKVLDALNKKFAGRQGKDFESIDEFLKSDATFNNQSNLDITRREVSQSKEARDAKKQVRSGQISDEDAFNATADQLAENAQKQLESTQGMGDAIDETLQKVVEATGNNANLLEAVTKRMSRYEPFLKAIADTQNRTIADFNTSGRDTAIRKARGN